LGGNEEIVNLVGRLRGKVWFVEGNGPKSNLQCGTVVKVVGFDRISNKSIEIDLSLAIAVVNDVDSRVLDTRTEMR
jgi:hypothetical protein